MSAHRPPELRLQATIIRKPHTAKAAARGHQYSTRNPHDREPLPLHILYKESYGAYRISARRQGAISGIQKCTDERNESPTPRRPILKYQNQERYVPLMHIKNQTNFLNYLRLFQPKKLPIPRPPDEKISPITSTHLRQVRAGERAYAHPHIYTYCTDIYSCTSTYLSFLFTGHPSPYKQRQAAFFTAPRDGLLLDRK